MQNVTRDDWIVGGLALALGIFLFVLPWFDLSVTIGPFTASATLTATDDPDGWLAIIAALASFLIVADLAIERLSPQTQIPAIGDRTNTRFVLAVTAAVFVALKFLFHIHFGDFGWGFYVNVIVTVALVYVAVQARAGGSIVPAGMSMPSMPSRSAAAPPPAPRPTPPPAPEPGVSSEAAGSGASGPSGGSTPPPGS
jgi:hypothetical protein